MKARKIILPILLAAVMAVTKLPPITARAASDPGNYTFDVSEGYIIINDAGSGNLTVTYGTPSKTTAAFPNTQNITITGKTTANWIDVSKSITTNITLEDVSIDKSGGDCAFYINDNSIVNLTLNGNNFLTSGDNHAGLRVTSTVNLTIGGTGALTSSGGKKGAGIGGGDHTSCGTITINSGTITAYGPAKAVPHGAAGIGGGYFGGGGIITINGGTVTAMAGNPNGGGMGGGAGIGGGYKGNGGTITINGGRVTAIGGNSNYSGGGAGIGGGYYGSGGTVNINGGIVRAQGYGSASGGLNLGSAGIGGGYRGGSGIITISGGTVTAGGKVYSPGIGCGYEGSGGEVYISGGSVKATGDGAQSIGGTNVTLQNNSIDHTPVFLTTVTLKGVISETAVSNLTTDPSYSYGMIDTFTGTGGILYIYLPKNTKTTAAQTSAASYTGDITTTDDHKAVGTLKTSPSTYAITYNANGGSGTMADGTATQGVAFTLPPNGFIAPDGKQFKEWAIGDAVTGARVAAGDSYSFTAPTTVYAVWEDTTLPTVFTVIPGGTDVSINTATLSVTFSEAMDTGTVGTVALDNGATVQNPRWSDGNKTVSCDLSGLGYNTTYTMTISGFKDAAGNMMTADSTHSFTTCVEPLSPSVSLNTLTVDKGGTASFTIAFGQGGAAATEAAITVGDSGIASVSQTQIATPGSVTVTGLAVGTTDITVVFNDTASTTAKVSVTVRPLAPTISTNSLPGGTAGAAYNQALAAKGDTPITWSKESGNLPDGLTLSDGGVISGIPTAAGTYTFTVKAANGAGQYQGT